MARLISFGKLNKYYIYILLAVFGNVFERFLSSLSHPKEERENWTEWKDEAIVLKHYLSREFIMHFCTFLFAFLLRKVELYKIKLKNIKKHMIISDQENKKSTSQIVLIHNKDDIYYISTKNIYFCSLILFLWFCEEHIHTIYLNVLPDLNFWMIELVIISFITSKMFKLKIYRHHTVAMYLNIIPLAVRINRIVYKHIRDPKQDRKEPIYLDNFGYIFFGVIIYIALKLTRAYVYSYIKWYMDLQYISIIRLLMHYAVIGITCSFLILMITSFVECPRSDFNDEICQVIKNGTDNQTYSTYYDNIGVYLKNSGKEEILNVGVGNILFFFIKVFSLLIIKYLTPVYLIFTIPFINIFTKLSQIVYAILKNDFNTDGKLDLIQLICELIGYIIAFISFLIYLEIIVLHFCKCDYNIKENIKNRGLIECKEINGVNDLSKSMDDDSDIIGETVGPLFEK